MSTRRSMLVCVGLVALLVTGCQSVPADVYGDSRLESAATTAAATGGDQVAQDEAPDAETAKRLSDEAPSVATAPEPPKRFSGNRRRGLHPKLYRYRRNRSHALTD